MATYVSEFSESQSERPDGAGETRYVARQPILNLRGHVHAYELLFRNAPDGISLPETVTTLNPEEAPEKPSGTTAEKAARTMLDNAVLFGFDWLTNGLPAFVRCTQQTLNEDLVLVLAPAKTILEIPGNVEPTQRLFDSCLKLKSRGFRLALDDFKWSSEGRQLAQKADYIRVKFDQVQAAERDYLRNLGGASPALVAKGVETQEDYQKACAEGFALFQGGYFCHPVLMQKSALPANKLLHFDIVKELHHDPLDVRKISRLVLRDASLTYRLLRLANSPLYAVQQEVRSIESAIMIAGENAFRRMVSLAVLSQLGDETTPEILHMTLVRARFCELAAGLCRLDSAEQYLLGMLSLVPAMLRMPMEEVAPSLPLRAEICEALLGAPNQERSFLSWIECHERGDWEACDAIVRSHRLSPEKVLKCYTDSVVWAASALQTAA